jgi:membrane protease YdiL (CAAX protease family)
MAERSLAVAGDGTAISSGTAFYFAGTIGFTSLLQLPAVLGMQGVLEGGVAPYMLPAMIAAFGPVVMAMVAARIEGKGGVVALFARLRRGPVGAAWYVVALGIFAAIYVASTAVYRALGGPFAGRWLYLPENPQHVAAMILMPLVEEPGWRGYALPRLQPRYGRIGASLLLGIGWALWHTTMFVLQGTTPLTFAVALVNIVAGSVIFSWIYNHTRGNLGLAILAHVGVHWNNPMHAVPANLTPFAVYTAGIVVAAIAVLVFDRAAWRAAPDVRAGSSPVSLV